MNNYLIQSFRVFQIIVSSGSIQCFFCENMFIVNKKVLVVFQNTRD